jgi:hypothetical protein
MAQEEPRVSLARRWVQPGRLTEVGPGAGGFAAAAAEAGFEVTVVDRDEAGCAHLGAALGVRAIASENPDRVLTGLPPSRVVALWHVLEHLADPWGTLRAAAANVEPSGLFMLATPNPQALSLRVSRSRWPHVDAPRHLFLLAAPELIRRARELGLELVHLTSDDPVGRQLNEHAWRYAAASPLVPTTRLRSRAWGFAAHLGSMALAPIERRGLRGATYTMVLLKSRPGT